MTAVLEGGEWSAALPGRTLPPGKTRYPFYRRLGGPQGRSGRAENLVPTGNFFFYQHTFIQVHCANSSTYVTDTVSIVPEVRLFIGQGALSHHRAFRSTSLSYTILVVHFAHISLPPHFILHKNARLTHFVAHVQH